eukprot:TRINITY_DN55528_c0_g1_i1.p1 TRINITY_DN55528_c0_g1~~TRINITY_DN55528_c0_g1_i1.p1  ORF type:complete len:355 (-),score=57.88 TRINITY_DN55528_c0_g1_i1:68-1132(-)
MFKKRERPTAARKTDNADGEGESGSVPTAAKKTKAAITSESTGSNEGTLIAASTKRGESDAASKLESRMNDATLSGWKAADTKTAKPSDDATRLLEVDTPAEQDARAIHERNEKINKGLKDGSLETGVYRGMSAYKRYANRSEGAIAANKYTGLLGPTRNTLSNVRSTMRIEYWNASSGTDGGICKDYKETGYCGYGDTCKYLHDRSDYKSGHVLEAEWEAKQKKLEAEKRKRWEKRMQKRAEMGADAGDSSPSSSEDSDDEELPQACPACNEKWEDCKSIPIQTVCGHYFCEDCAMTNFARTPRCMTCDALTNGIFNSCDALEEKLKRKKNEKAELKQQRSSGSRADPFSVGR